MTLKKESASVGQAPAGGAAKAPARSKKWIRGAVLGILVVILAVSIPYYLRSLAHETTDDAFIDGNVIPVDTRLDGHITRITVEDNQWVKAGELLVELDQRFFEVRLDAAQAALDAARASDQTRNIEVALTQINATAELNEANDNVAAKKAEVEEARARVALAKATLEQVKAEADSATAKHQLDLTDLKRYREMAKAQRVSRQDLEHAEAAEQISAAALAAVQRKIETQTAAVQESQAALKAAEANLRQASARLAAAQSAPQRINQSRSQAEVAHAEFNRAKAEAAQARLNLSYAKIYAPCDGFVTKKRIEVGQYVQEGQALLAIVPRTLWVTANFKETQLAHLRAGQPVEIRVDTYPDFTLEGVVDSIQHGTGARFSLLPAENATGNFVKVVQRVPVKIVLDRAPTSPRVLLVPGMSVVADVDVGAGYSTERPAADMTDNAPLTPTPKEVDSTP